MLLLSTAFWTLTFVLVFDYVFNFWVKIKSFIHVEESFYLDFTLSVCLIFSLSSKLMWNLAKNMRPDSWEDVINSIN